MKKKFITFLLFGGNGDLASRKIFPHLFSLYCSNFKDQNITINIVAVGRKKISLENFRINLLKNIEYEKYQVNEELCIKAFICNNTYYFSSDLENKSEVSELEKYVSELESKSNAINPLRLFFFSLPPKVYLRTLETISETKLVQKRMNKRILIEKPFGLDLKTATVINKKLLTIFDQGEIYCIDHFLYKGIIENLINFRMKNIGQSLLGNSNIQKIEIIMDEHDGINSRGEYYETAGVIRDMFQNHLLQLLMYLCAQEVHSDKKRMEQEKVDVLKLLYMTDINSLVGHRACIGQYIGNSEGGLISYKDEYLVDEDSQVPTFFSILLNLQNNNSENTHIYIRTGKAIKKKQSYILIYLKKPINHVSTVKISNEKIELVDCNNEVIEITQSSTINNEYGVMILDAINMNTEKFVTWSEIKYSWLFVDNLINHLHKKEFNLIHYQRNSEGESIDDKLKSEVF